MFIRLETSGEVQRVDRVKFAAVQNPHALCGFLQKTSMGITRDSAIPRELFAKASAARSPWISWTARYGGFSPRSTIARDRAANAKLFFAVLRDFKSVKPLASRPSAVSDGVARKLDSVVCAHGVG